MKSSYCKSNKMRPLEGFIQVARTKSVTEAAKRMGISQAAVSQQIASLEEELGIRLFQRLKKRLHLTPEGTRLYELATPRVQAIEELYEIFAESTKKPANKLDIAATHTSILYILPPLLKAFREQNAEADIMVRNIARDDAIERLIKEEIDIVLYPTQGDIPIECEFLPIIEFDPILLIRKDHPLATKEDLNLEDVANFNLLRIDPHLITLPLFEQTLQTFNIKSNIHFEASDWEILKKFVKADLGVAIISNICLEENEDILIGRKLPKYFPSITYGILYKKGTEKLINLHNFITIIKNQANYETGI